MVWQYVLTAISFVLYFGFVILGVCKFGLLSCYSAYGPKWQPDRSSKINWWQIITCVTALLIVPVLLECSEGNPYQFLGFLAPASLLLVGATPDYQTNNFSMILHQIGAWSAVVFITAYSILIPNLWWVVAILVAISIVLGIIKKGTFMFWAEMAMYLSTFIIVFLLIGGKVGMQVLR